MNIIGSIDGLGMGAIGPDSIVNADCLEAMKLIPDKSIDCVICDLPYGITACKWDTVIPFDRLWEQYKRIIKPNGAIVLFGSQPFTSALVMSNPKWFKYEWIWEKNRFSGFLNAKRKPLCGHENILIFANGKTTYNPQFRSYSIETLKRRPAGEITKTGVLKSNIYTNKGDPDYMAGSKIHGAYPTTVFKAKCVDQNSGRFAPTQKPVFLIEYLIKTYSQEGELILDNTSGSSTLAIACLNTNRRYICIEKDPHYFQVSCDRVATHNPNAPIVKPKKPKALPKGQLALF